MGRGATRSVTYQAKRALVLAVTGHGRGRGTPEWDEATGRRGQPWRGAGGRRPWMVRRQRRSTAAAPAPRGGARPRTTRGRRCGRRGGARAYGRPRAEAGKEEDEAVVSPGFVGSGQQGLRRRTVTSGGGEAGRRGGGSLAGELRAPASASTCRGEGIGSPPDPDPAGVEWCEWGWLG